MARPRKPWFRKRRNDWCVTVDGRQVSLAVGQENKAQAVRAYHRLMAERDEPADGGPAPSGSMVDLLGKFLTWTKSKKAPATYEQRRYYLKSFLHHPRVRGVRPDRLTVGLVEEWLDAHPRWKASRRHAVLAVLRAFNWAVRRGLVARNPVAAVDVPKPTRVLAYLSRAQRAAILAAVPDRAFREFLQALEATGCRPGEVAAVTAAEADLRAGLWVLPEHKTADRTGKPRTVYLTAAMAELTRRLAAERPEGPLFLNSRKKPWNRNAVRCRFRKLRARFPDFGHFTAYSYRRAYVTDALENGVDVVQVAELVGHKGTDMIMGHYHQLQERVRHMKDMAERVTAGTGQAKCSA